MYICTHTNIHTYVHSQFIHIKHVHTYICMYACTYVPQNTHAHTILTVKDGHFIIDDCLLPIAVLDCRVILLYKVRLDELNGKSRLAHSTTSHHHYLVLAGTIDIVRHLTRGGEGGGREGEGGGGGEGEGGGEGKEGKEGRGGGVR